MPASEPGLPSGLRSHQGRAAHAAAAGAGDLCPSEMWMALRSTEIGMGPHPLEFSTGPRRTEVGASLSGPRRPGLAHRRGAPVRERPWRRERPERSREAREGALSGGELASRIRLVEERHTNHGYLAAMEHRCDNRSAAVVWRCTAAPSLPRDANGKRRKNESVPIITSGRLVNI